MSYKENLSRTNKNPVMKIPMMNQIQVQLILDLNCPEILNTKENMFVKLKPNHLCATR